ncbi:TPA: glycosyltransferase [Vibrio parahaemolyticus]|nr:glycosyltransferase [Vibrio parahaemolyticus]HCG6494757.1 glycosyltransferase [Vibrio parahaemolyticus]
MVGLFVDAQKSFNAGKYKEARKKFELAGKKYGENFVRYNIHLCDKYETELSSEKYQEIDINSYFDCIYLVNLKSHVSRKLKAIKHLNERRINFKLFEATNGYQGEALEKYNEYSKRELGRLERYPEYREKEIERGKGYIESPGAIGYIYTYINILKDAKENGFKKILILEDDVLLDVDFQHKFSQLITTIPETWKVLQLGASQYEWGSVEESLAIENGFYFPRQLDTCGSFALALDRDVFEQLIEAESAFEAPFDHLPLGEIYEKYLGECFVAFPNIVMPCVADSSIRGGRCQYTHGAKMKWDIDNFDYPLSKVIVNLLVHSSSQLKYFDLFKATIGEYIDLRVFINTEDGPRPLHQCELMSLPYNRLKVNGGLTLPKADLTLECKLGAVLTEEMLIEYVDSWLCKREVTDFPLNKLCIEAIKETEGKVSIIIPTYKRPKNLSNALESVADQDYENKEIIVVCDNGQNSEYNQETKVIVDNIKLKYPKVDIKIIFHENNRNGAAARNTGFLNSSGEFISLLDDDDIYLPGRLTETVNALQNSNSSIGAVYCGFLGWNSPVNNLERYAEGDLTKEILMLDYMKHYLHTNTALYKRSAYEKLNGFDESYRRHQDLEFNLRFFEHYKILAVKKALVQLNPEPSDISNKVFDSRMLELKSKFLNQFESTINQFEEETTKNIYQTHWREVYKYITDKEEMTKYISLDIKNGNLQVGLLLGEEN